MYLIEQLQQYLFELVYTLKQLLIDYVHIFFTDRYTLVVTDHV